MTQKAKRNIAIAVFTLFVLYLAKMEAINFIVAVWAGIWVMVKLWPWAVGVERKSEETMFDSTHSLPAFIAGVLYYITIWPISPALAFLPGVASSFLVYFLLNLLFIPAK